LLWVARKVESLGAQGMSFIISIDLEIPVFCNEAHLAKISARLARRNSR
jgi:hypothetical protein